MINNEKTHINYPSSEFTKCFFSKDDSSPLQQALLEDNLSHPFHHDLEIHFLPGKHSACMLCCHEFGGNASQILDRVSPYTSNSLISFNAIDYNFSHETGDDSKTVMATPLEVIPLLYMLKAAVIKGKLESLSLYGYGLGASNIIHALTFLYTNEKDTLLEEYGISQADKTQILQSLSQGSILLDTPFKSIEEIISLRGSQKTLLMYQKRAQDHCLASPIDSLKKLAGLKLNFFVFFDSHNEVFSNRDDDLFEQNLKEANQEGFNLIIRADNSGYFAHHPSLWKAYEEHQLG